MLTEYSRAGDVDAARYLIGLYRDGYGALLQPDRKAALDLLDFVAGYLGPDMTAIERIKLLAAGCSLAGHSPTQQDRPALFQLLHPQQAMSVLRDLRRRSAHAYVYFIQQQLAERGIYDGPLSGILDSRTISAFKAACDKAGALRTCAPGPLTDITARVLGGFLFAPTPPASAA